MLYFRSHNSSEFLQYVFAIMNGKNKQSSQKWNATTLILYAGAGVLKLWPMVHSPDLKDGSKGLLQLFEYMSEKI